MVSESYQRLAPELEQLDRLIEEAGAALEATVLTTVTYQKQQIPIQAVTLGSAAVDAPTLVFTGGIHGIERIGSQVVLAFLQTLVRRLQWDNGLRAGLQQLRLVFVPVVNPVGIIRQTRANGAGVDLMRNAPIDAEARVPFLIGGQRVSASLPWYRGERDAPMQPESQAVSDLVRRLLSTSPFTLSLDVHSGYGFLDRLWFPLACSHRPVEDLPEIYRLCSLLETTYPNLAYVVEPQSHHYLAHGDLWDYLYLEARRSGAGIFLPMTLEMGSWNWVKKNWRQTGSVTGWFNPVMPHRVQRVLRRHTILLEFLLRAVRSYTNWVPDSRSRERCRQAAIQRWYSQRGARRGGGGG